MKGYIQVYTGNGKGKTTAAIGLAVRALGAGLKVYLAQFLKYEASSEINWLTSLPEHSAPAPRLVIEQYGKPREIGPFFDQEDKLLVEAGWQKTQQLVQAGNFDLIILDEVNIALHYQLIPVDEMLNLLANKPDHLELVLTGRYAPPAIISAADLVTDMQCIKHYFVQGVIARPGIEK